MAVKPLNLLEDIGAVPVNPACLCSDSFYKTDNDIREYMYYYM